MFNSKEVSQLWQQTDPSHWTFNELAEELINHSHPLRTDANTTVTYVNTKHGIPNWFKEHYGLVLGDVETPYVFELWSDLYETHNATKDNVKFYPIARGRLVNKDAITYAQSSLISGSQLQRNQIYQLDNINNSVNN